VLTEQGGRLLLVELPNIVEQSVDLQGDWSVNRSTLAISADAAQLAYMSGNTDILTVVDSRGRLIAELPDTVETRQIAFSPDGRTLAVEMPTSVLFWSLPEGQVRAEVPAWTNLDGPAFRFSPDGTLALLTRDDDLLLVRAEDGSVLQTLRAGTLNAFAFSPDGAYIVAALNSATIAMATAGSSRWPLARTAQRC
jgi:WD40 repeat protein